MRPTWDEYFLALAEAVSTRSPDAHTRHGCVLVDSRNVLISTGYNGPIRGIDHAAVPLTRPEKYPWMIHAEDNALLFAHRDCGGATAYITGFPCASCTRRILQAGIVRIVCGNRASSCVPVAEREVCEAMAVACGVKIEVR